MEEGQIDLKESLKKRGLSAVMVNIIGMRVI